MPVDMVLDPCIRTGALEKAHVIQHKHQKFTDCNYVITVMPAREDDALSAGPFCVRIAENALRRYQKQMGSASCVFVHEESKVWKK